MKGFNKDRSFFNSPFRIILFPPMRWITKTVRILLLKSKVTPQKQSCLHQLSPTSGTSSPHLVDAVIAVSLFGGVFADAPPLGTAHHPNRLPCPPVLGLCSKFVIERCVAIEGKRPAEEGGSKGEEEGSRWDQSV